MTISRFYRILLALCGLAGVSIQIHDDGWGMLLYYTVLSNILVFSSLIFFIIYDFKKEMLQLTPNSSATRVA